MFGDSIKDPGNVDPTGMSTGIDPYGTFSAEAAGPSPGQLVNISAAEQTKFKHLFDLMDTLAPLMALMDRLVATFQDTANPPDFVTRVWVFPNVIPKPGEQAIGKSWKSWQELRADYQSAVNELMSSYQNVAVNGLGQVLSFAILAVITIVAVATVLYEYISTESDAPPQVKILEAATAAGLSPDQGNEAVTAYNQLQNKLAIVAKENGISLPAALAKISSNFVTIALIAAIGYLAWELFRHEK